MTDDTPYALFLVWRVGGALFCLAIVTACIFACRCCSKRARRPVPQNPRVLPTVSNHNGQSYPMVYENGEWGLDRSGNQPFNNPPYQSGAPLSQNSQGPVMSGAPPYNPPPYPPVGVAAPPYSPPGENYPPPSYSVAIRGGRSFKDISQSQEGIPTTADTRHSERQSHPKPQPGKGDSSRHADR